MIELEGRFHFNNATKRAAELMAKKIPINKPLLWKVHNTIVKEFGCSHHDALQVIRSGRAEALRLAQEKNEEGFREFFSEVNEK